MHELMWSDIAVTRSTISRLNTSLCRRYRGGGPRTLWLAMRGHVCAAQHSTPSQPVLKPFSCMQWIEVQVHCNFPGHACMQSAVQCTAWEWQGIPLSFKATLSRPHRAQASRQLSISILRHSSLPTDGLAFELKHAHIFSLTHAFDRRSCITCMHGIATRWHTAWNV